MRIIGHIDLDAFFAAVEERDTPQFRGLPIVVGADPKNGEGRGVVSTANYKARDYGIHSAMPISKAWRLAEEAKKNGKPATMFLSTNSSRYSEVSREIIDLLRSHVPRIEQTSIDEAYLDLSFLESYEKAKQFAQKLKKEILKKEYLTASIGVGPNKLIAKIASGFEKPDGLVMIPEDDLELFLEPLPIRIIPGVGPKTETVLKRKGIMTIQDAKQFSRRTFEELFGKWGSELYEKIRGRDNAELETSRLSKSIGEQETFEADTRNSQIIFESLSRMCEHITGYIVEEGFKEFKTIILMVRFADFETKTRRRTLDVSCGVSNTKTAIRLLKAETLKLFLPFLDKRENPREKHIRLVGVRVEGLL